MSRKEIESLLYSIANYIDRLIEFKILSKSLRLMLFSFNKNSKSSRKRLHHSKKKFVVKLSLKNSIVGLA